MGIFSYMRDAASPDIETLKLKDGTQMKFRTKDEKIQVYQNQSWSPFFSQGVNVGASLPGHYPGELPIKKEDYMRWFKQIHEMGANTIRIYTIHDPVFYEALVEFNQNHGEDPLYFMQGVWSPVNELDETQNAHASKVTNAFKKELKNAVGAIYGDITLPESHGNASGEYTVNAAPYLLAWHIGTEWDPKMVKKTNEKNNGKSFKGNHFQSKSEASSFENWLAELMNYTAALEKKRGWEHPMTFTNWVTTDPLKHPKEPFPMEDAIEVDATQITTNQWEAGYFASYHVYPYYPDFFRYSDQYKQVKGPNGKSNNYRGYLRDLKDYHNDLPIMVTEFGVPSSLGSSHIGENEWNQGGHTEQQQGEINKKLFNNIYQEDYAGAILFSWQDEWFKKTWNTMFYDNPDRRAYWYNALSSEQSFGVLGMYPSKTDDIQIDGKTDDWENVEDKEKLDMKRKGWEDIWVTHDEGYLYIHGTLSQPYQPEQQTLYLGIDSLPGGNRQGKPLGDKKLDKGLESIIQLSKKEKSFIKVASNYDFHQRLYGESYGMKDVKQQHSKENSGIFKPWKLALSLKTDPPHSKFSVPFDDVTVQLNKGSTDPESKTFNSHILWQAKDKSIELKIPWAMLGFSDPSKRKAISYEDVTENNSFSTEKSKGIRILPWIVEQNKETVKGLGKQNPVPVSELPIYQWETWDKVDYYEHLKSSYYTMKKAFQSTNK
ncbi:hypothetical protein [Pontibacillus sp. HMF3514]|uniref:hypothetical protein n=1 Tax=Pontibacillus sp. HMF3514 TaxID=2692425 RepID=UPI001F47FE47|nr:hypothetical protein [Pontibacillus sp. HMF3514]